MNLIPVYSVDVWYRICHAVVLVTPLRAYVELGI